MTPERWPARVWALVVLGVVLVAAFPFAWRYFAWGSLRVVNQTEAPVTVLFEFEGKARVFRDVEPGRSSHLFVYKMPNSEGPGPGVLVRAGPGRVWCGGYGYVDVWLSVVDHYTLTPNGLAFGDPNPADTGGSGACPAKLLELEARHASVEG